MVKSQHTHMQPSCFERAAVLLHTASSRKGRENSTPYGEVIQLFHISLGVKTGAFSL